MSSVGGLEVATAGVESLVADADFAGRFFAALLIRSSNRDLSFSDIYTQQKTRLMFLPLKLTEFSYIPGR